MQRYLSNFKNFHRLKVSSKKSISEILKMLLVKWEKAKQCVSFYVTKSYFHVFLSVFLSECLSLCLFLCLSVFCMAVPVCQAV